MDNYTKIICKFLIVLMLCLTIFYIVQFRIKIIEDLRKITIETNAIGLSSQYIDNVWNNSSNVTKDVETKGFSELYNNSDFISFASNTIAVVKDLPVVKLNIYDINKRKLISNNKFNVFNYEYHKDQFNGNNGNYLNNKFDSFLFPSIEDEASFAQVLKGSVFSQIIPHASFTNKNNAEFGTLVQVLIPIINNNKTEGFIEFYYDITKEWDDIELLQNVSFIGSFLTFCLFFVTLVLVSHKLEKMIEKQHEVNTELAEAKEKAEVESSEKSKFLANISHELRTPLNAIIGFSEIIKTEALGPVANQQYRDYANDINNSGTHLLSLINDILDYSKAAAEKLKVDAIELDVTKILTTSLRLVTPRAEEAKVNLVDAISKETLILIADPKRLKQAVLNLLSNSVKFTPENGTVTLSAWIDREKNLMMIQVKDTGIGIADKDISKAMSTFGQVDSKLSRKYEGTGLGLPLTKKLVELMKGSFNIQSELGFGTTVTLSFNYMPENANADSMKTT